MTDWRILVVEDDLDGQEVMATIFDHLQIPVDVVGDADEAEALLFGSGNNYQAVVIDLALPGKDGWGLLSAIQAEPATADLPCIAVTAYHTSKLREEAIKRGFTAYFPKPIDATSFARQLENLL